ncbi:polysaccharide deacetylase family protein [Paenibacillus medicaginis]|uniref:Polysaccharide deacetylase family protein n=1 Tax=Paenibacillus medicaginis TaxID=1470560 RepID=A0ABV5C9K7_9BACL
MSRSKRKGKVYYRDCAVVLTYHDLDPDVHLNSPYCLTPRLFGEHLDALKQNGFKIINMESFIKFMKSGKRIPPNAVVITFDDGEKSFYTYAYPLLMQRCVKATNFIVGKKIDAGRGISWDQMREMKQNGFSFYSHTYNHHRNSNYGENKRLLTSPQFLENENRLESAIEYEHRVLDDLSLIENRIQEELGEQTKLLSFPFGAYNDKVVEMGQSMGIELFFTVNRGLNHTGQWLVKRINAGEGDLSPESLIQLILNYAEQ